MWKGICCKLETILQPHNITLRTCNTCIWLRMHTAHSTVCICIEFVWVMYCTCIVFCPLYPAEFTTIYSYLFMAFASKDGNRRERRTKKNGKLFKAIIYQMYIYIYMCNFRIYSTYMTNNQLLLPTPLVFFFCWCWALMHSVFRIHATESVDFTFGFTFGQKCIFFYWKGIRIEGWATEWWGDWIAVACILTVVGRVILSPFQRIRRSIFTR